MNVGVAAESVRTIFERPTPKLPTDRPSGSISRDPNSFSRAPGPFAKTLGSLFENRKDGRGSCVCDNAAGLIGDNRRAVCPQLFALHGSNPGGFEANTGN